MAVNNATLLLDDFCGAGIAVEVTHRSKRRLFGLTGLAPLRDVVRPPYRPEPGRGRGRPPLAAEDAITVPALPSAPPTPLDRRPFDYSDLAHWMTQMDQAIRQARRTLATFQHGTARRQNPASSVAERTDLLVPLHSDFDRLICTVHGCPSWWAQPVQRVKITVEGQSHCFGRMHFSAMPS